MSTQLKPQSLDTNLLNGWIDPQETWEYVSVDDPTGIFRVNADVTGKYSAGMRIKFTNGTYVIYGIVTVVGSYSGGYTSITFLHQIDPTDSLALYLMANSAITANYYSTQKAPFGFPLDPRKWSVILTSTSSYASNEKSSPTDNTWYNLGSRSLSVPIGLWNCGYHTGFRVVASNNFTNMCATLSTASDSESYEDLTQRVGTNEANGEPIRGNFSRYKIIEFASKTTLYLNGLHSGSGATSIAFEGSTPNGMMKIEAICAYL